MFTYLMNQLIATLRTFAKYLITNNTLFHKVVIHGCSDQSSVINSETDLRHRASMLGNGRGPREVGPRRTY